MCSYIVLTPSVRNYHVNRNMRMKEKTFDSQSKLLTAVVLSLVNWEKRRSKEDQEAFNWDASPNPPRPAHSAMETKGDRQSGCNSVQRITTSRVNPFTHLARQRHGGISAATVITDPFMPSHMWFWMETELSVQPCRPQGLTGDSHTFFK